MSLDQAIQEAVVKAVQSALAPYLRRLADPDPLVYSVPEAATVLCTSETTVRRLIRSELLPTVPHIPGRTLIPRVAVARFIESGGNRSTEPRPRLASIKAANAEEETSA